MLALVMKLVLEIWHLRYLKLQKRKLRLDMMKVERDHMMLID